MKKIRVVLSLVLLASVLMLFNRCTTDAGLKSGETEIVFSVWGTPEQTKVEKTVIAEFEKEHPNIKVKLYALPNMRYHDKILTMATSGTAPDVMMIEINRFPFFVSKGILMPLDDKIKADKINLKDIYPLALKAFKVNGKQYGFPRDISGYVMYYNKDLFDKAGLKYPDSSWTWKDFANACAKLKKDTNGDGIIDQFGAINPPFYIIVWGFGGDIFDNPYNPKKCIITSPASIKGLKFDEMLMRKKYVAPAQQVREQGDYMMFMTGKVGMYFNGRWMAPVLKQIKTFKWDAVDVPKGINGKRWTLHGGTCYAISSTTKHPKEAWEFLKFYTSKKGVSIAIKGGRTTPIYKSIANSKEFLSMSPPKNMKAVVDTMLYGRRISYIVLNNELADIITRNGQMFEIGNYTAEQFAENLKKEIDERILGRMK